MANDLPGKWEHFTAKLLRDIYLMTSQFFEGQAELNEALLNVGSDAKSFSHLERATREFEDTAAECHHIIIKIEKHKSEIDAEYKKPAHLNGLKSDLESFQGSVAALAEALNADTIEVAVKEGDLDRSFGMSGANSAVRKNSSEALNALSSLLANHSAEVVDSNC